MRAICDDELKLGALKTSLVTDWPCPDNSFQALPRWFFILLLRYCFWFEANSTWEARLVHFGPKSPGLPCCSRIGDNFRRRAHFRGSFCRALAETWHSSELLYSFPSKEGLHSCWTEAAAGTMNFDAGTLRECSSRDCISYRMTKICPCAVDC